MILTDDELLAALLDPVTLTGSAELQQLADWLEIQRLSRPYEEAEQMRRWARTCRQVMIPGVV